MLLACESCRWFQASFVVLVLAVRGGTLSPAAVQAVSAEMRVIVSLEVVCADGSLSCTRLSTILVPGGSICVDIAILAMASSVVRLCMGAICHIELSPTTFPAQRMPEPAVWGMRCLVSPPLG